jgi:uncharacterized protein
MNGRRIDLDLKYNNQNITADIKDFVSSISFTDNLSGDADEISLSIGDREKKWTHAWIPKMGASIEASILISADWGSANASKRKLGYFEIDQLGTGYPPMTISIGGISIPEHSSLRGTKKTKAWEKTNLKKIAGDIAKKNGLKLYFSVQENPEYDRIDQQSQSDVAFLYKTCSEAGLSLKIANKSLTILDDAHLESKPEVVTIHSNDSRIKNYRGSYKQTGIYKSCKVSFTNTSKKKTYSHTFTPKNPPATSRVLIVNEEVSSQADAQRLAKNKLREANKDSITMAFTLSGFSNLYAGQTIMLKSFGAFDGKYIITGFNGTVGAGSETSLELRKCLEGY